MVIYCAENYVKITDLWAVKAVAHELAHAFHLQQWPEKQPDILAAYNSAMESTLYLNVKNNKGGTFKKAYATVNQLEYFAELSCMYFVGCNYQPYNKRQLKAYDPTGHAMIEKMWATKSASRTWTDSSGDFKIEAEFVEFKNSQVKLKKKDGKTISLPMSKLSKADQEYVRNEIKSRKN